jgi:uncharacterized protein (TIRG00374 family)
MNRKLLLQILKWVVSLSLIAWLYARVDWNDFGSLLAESAPIFLVLSFALITWNTLLCSYKWQLFLRKDDLPRPLGELFVSYWIGHFVSLFLPSNIGGDTYRVYHLGAQTKQGVRSFTSVFADRFSGFLALSLIGLVGAIIGYQFIQNLWVLGVLVVFIGLFGAMLILILDSRIIRFFLDITRLGKVGPFKKAYESFVETFRTYGSDGFLVSKVMLISVLFHLNW